MSKIEDFVKRQEAILEELNEAELERKKKLTLVDRRAMRMTEACFYPAYRDKFVTKNDSMTRQELDARNSRFKVDDFWTLACGQFNNEKWIPTSTSLPDLHDHLKDSIDLKFEGEKCAVHEFKAWNKKNPMKVTVANSNWRTSGNGFGNVVPRIKGLFYENEPENDVEHVDDNKICFFFKLQMLVTSGQLQNVLG